MNPKKRNWGMWMWERENLIEKEIIPTFDELKEEMTEILEQIKQVNKLSVSQSIKDNAISELEQQKAKIVELMHKSIDKTYG